jgi:hypothetical protein
VVLVIGGKAIGGQPPATPLTELEQTLVEVLSATMRSTNRTVSVQDIEAAIAALDPDALTSILDNITMRPSGRRLDDVLRATFLEYGDREIRRVLRMDPAMQRGTVMDVGVRLPSGIVVPSDLAPVDVSQMKLTPFQTLNLTYIDPRAVDYARSRSASLVTSIDNNNRLAIRYVIGDSIARGLTAMETADMLEKMIGLHPRWARAVINFDGKTFQSLLSQGIKGPAARAQTNALTKRYRDSLIRRRAEMIARTEVQTAQNMARQSAWDVGARTGYVDAASTKRWLVSPPGSRRGAPCDICAALNKTEVQWNQAFPTGHIMPPAHPHCRCTAVLVPPSRGLTNLPSQNLDYWLSEMDAFYAEEEA